MNQLRAYQNSLQSKCEAFVQALAQKGIAAGEIALGGADEDAERHGGYGKYITFSVETNPDRYGVKAVLAATNTGIIKSEWRQADGSVSEADVSPILMAEFGSGLRANNERAGEFGMGTGTFPGQTHAEDPTGWWYMDLDDQWHHSYGVTPSMPMANAFRSMFDAIAETAKEVFGS